jgi:hypothetical protein
MGLLEKQEKRIVYFKRLLSIMVIGLVVSLPYLLPLIISYFKNGWESWQTAFFTPAGLDLWLPIFNLQSINNLFFLFGFATLIYLRNNRFVKILLYLFLTAFIWWGLGMVSLLLFKKPFQEFRGFYILAPSILAIASAYGLEKLWNYYNISKNKNLSFTLAVLGIACFASQSVFGFFIDDTFVKNRRVESRNLAPEVSGLVNYLKSSPSAENTLTLETTPQILAFVPINNLIYFNQHNNNPSAIFSKRFAYVQSLSAAITPDELYRKILNCPFGKLDQLIFYKDRENYYLYFHLDKIIKGIEEKEIKISQSLFSPDYFDLKYDNGSYVVIDVKDVK